jgi:hypothetical protein
MSCSIWTMCEFCHKTAHTFRFNFKIGDGCHNYCNECAELIEKEQNKLRNQFKEFLERGAERFYARWNQISCRPNTKTRLYYCKHCQKTYTNNQIRGTKKE